MSDPLVSIIMPVFNRFQVVNRAIKSVIDQTYQNVELIIIDDCSSEIFKMPDLNGIDKFTVKLIRNSVNIGPGLTRQRGLEMSKGTYICFMDSDDYHSPEFLSKSVMLHMKNPGITATYTIAQTIGTDCIRTRSDISYTGFIPALLEGPRPWATSSLLWNKSKVAKWKNLRTNQDYLFEMDCAMINNSILHIPELLCFEDKATNENVNDLVSEQNRIQNRNYVYQYALRNYLKFKVSSREMFIVKIKAINRLFISSIKMMKFQSIKRIYENAKLLSKFKLLYGIFLILSFPFLLNRKSSLFISKVFEKIFISNIK